MDRRESGPLVPAPGVAFGRWLPPDFRRERGIAFAGCALLHLLFFLVLNDPRPAFPPDATPRLPSPEPIVVWLPITKPGELAGRAIGTPLPGPGTRSHREIETAVMRHATGGLGRDERPRPGAGGPEGAATQPEAREAPLAERPAASSAADGGAVDWRTAAQRIAREIASRYSNVDADGSGTGADGHAPRGLFADGSNGDGRPDCGKIYSGAAILGTGLWQYDGDPQHGCEWR